MAPVALHARLSAKHAHSAAELSLPPELSLPAAKSVLVAATCVCRMACYVIPKDHCGVQWFAAAPRGQLSQVMEGLARAHCHYVSLAMAGGCALPTTHAMLGGYGR